MASLVNEMVLETKGTFENKREHSIRKYGVYGTTVKRKLYTSDEKDRYFHIYHSDAKQAAEREQVEVKIKRIAKYLVRTKAKYDESVAALKELLAKKKAMQNEELLKIFENSNKTYDEVASFLTEGGDTSCIDEEPKKKLGRKPKG